MFQARERFSIKRGFGLRSTLARLGKRSVCCYNLPSVTNPTQPTTRKRGRPRLGDWRLEITLPATVKHELLRREEATGLYRSRIAAAILTRELIGENASSGQQH